LWLHNYIIYTGYFISIFQESQNSKETRTDYKTNKQTAKELKITPVLDKLLEYKRKWIQHINRMPRNRLPRVMKHYSPTGRKNHGRPLKRLLDTWDRNGSTSGPTPWYNNNNNVLLLLLLLLLLCLLSQAYSSW